MSIVRMTNDENRAAIVLTPHDRPMIEIDDDTIAIMSMSAIEHVNESEIESERGYEMEHLRPTCTWNEAVVAFDKTGDRIRIIVWGLYDLNDCNSISWSICTFTKIWRASLTLTHRSIDSTNAPASMIKAEMKNVMMRGTSVISLNSNIPQIPANNKEVFIERARERERERATIDQ